MPKYFAVEMSIIAIVEVPDDASSICASDYAERFVKSEKYDIVSDADPDVTVLEEIKFVDDLAKHGWDGMCVPYGDDAGNERLKYLLPTKIRGNT